MKLLFDRIDNHEITLKTKYYIRGEKIWEPPYKYAMLQLTYSPSVHNTFMNESGREKEQEGGEEYNRRVEYVACWF